MQLVRIVIFILVLLLTNNTYGELGDASQIVENSRLNMRVPTPPLSLAAEGISSVATTPKPATSVPVAVPAPAPTPAVPATIAERIEKAASDVKSWWNSKIQELTGQTPKVAAPTAPVAPVAPAPQEAVAPTPAPAVVEAPPSGPALDSLKAELPTVTTPREVTATDLKAMRAELKANGAQKVAKPGRKAQADLKVNKSGVPVYKVSGKGVKAIPRLDVGEEPTLTRADFLIKDYVLPVTSVTEVKRLASPDMMKSGELKEVTGLNIAAVEQPKDMDKNVFGIDQIVTRETIAKAQPKIKDLQTISEKEVRSLDEDDLLMLAALILYKKGDRCHALIGLLDRQSKIERMADEANFYLGTCAHQLKMYTLSMQRLGDLIEKENPDYTGEAVRVLSQDLPSHYENEFAKIILNLKDKKLIPTKVQDRVQYLTAKGAFKSGKYDDAVNTAEKIPESSSYYAEAQYIIGVSQHTEGKIGKAIVVLNRLNEWMSKNREDKNLRSLIALNLARMLMTIGKFKESLNHYAAIEKDHPFWVQGLIEQGWAQMAIEDFSGAIGNMYSIHSPYFKAVYKPESFVVRTIGYLNICQYADAYRTLSWLEHEYRPWLDRITTFTSQKKNGSEYYETVKNYLRNRNEQSADGLPYQVVREMVRQKGFLNLQTALNDKSDEGGRYEGLDRIINNEKARLKAREQKSVARFKELKAKIKQAETEKGLQINVEQWKQQMRFERELVIALRYQHKVFDMSKEAYQPLRTKTLAQLEKVKQDLRGKVGGLLVAQLKAMKSDLQTVLENNEFLRYEVFSGSGENIRYRVAGGKTGDANRVPADVKPTKMLNWAFEGEYWEDEIGNYRSSLQNNCPNQGSKMSGFFKNKDEDSGKDAAKK